MEPLPQSPKTFREIVEADLRRAARLIVKIQDEIDPQIRMATPEGDYHMALTLPGDDYGRRTLLWALGNFMVWRQALAFTWACELFEPDSVYCVGVSGTERYAALARINRQPQPWTAANFGEIEWLGQDSIDPEMIKLLPAGPRALTPKDVSTCNAWFGIEGKFPAVHLPSMEVRGV